MLSRSFLFFLVLNFSFFFAQEEQLPPSTVIDSVAAGVINDGRNMDSLLSTNYSTENVLYPKIIPADFKNKYKTKDFDYTTITPKESLWAKIKRRFAKIWESIFGDPANAVSGMELSLKIIAIIVIGVALFFILKFLFGKDGNFFFSKKNKVVNINSSVLHENIHEINFNDSIADFENKKEYRSAIRYHFLLILKKLSDKKLIQWNPEKTNTDYIAEIANANQKDSYQKLSYIFENVWYGEQKIDEELYSKLKNNFTDSPLSKNKIL